MDRPMTCHHRMLRAATAAVLGLALGLGAAACGTDSASDSSAGSSTAANHNDADVTFASAMIPHHAQALVMVDMLEGRDISPELAQLAARIKAAQAPEIELMQGWLEAWGEDVPSGMPGMSGMAHHDHMGMDDDESETSDGESDAPSEDASPGLDDLMPGMMSEQDLDELRADIGSAFEAMWLRMMIVHHEGAIAMAKAEQTQGRYQPALDLAGQIITSQQAEIDEMKAMLEGLATS